MVDYLEGATVRTTRNHALHGSSSSSLSSWSVSWAEEGGQTATMATGVVVVVVVVWERDVHVHVGVLFAGGSVGSTLRSGGGGLAMAGVQSAAVVELCVGKGRGMGCQASWPPSASELDGGHSPVVGQCGRTTVRDVVVPATVIGRTMEGMGIIGSGVKMSPALRPAPT